MPLDPTFLSFRERVVWQRIFAWWPRRCAESARLVWLKPVWVGTMTWTGPGDPIIEHSWLSEEEYLMCCLRGVL